eukprot:g9384.t1
MPTWVPSWSLHTDLAGKAMIEEHSADKKCSTSWARATVTGDEHAPRKPSSAAIVSQFEWDQKFSIELVLWPSRSSPPSDLVQFAKEHNTPIDVGFCTLLGGVIGNHTDDEWRQSMADAAVDKAFTRIEAVCDALSSPDVPHQIFYHILSSTLPSYLMHTLRITPPAILLPILDRFHLRYFRSLDCFGASLSAFDSLSYFVRLAFSSQLFLPCHLGGFKLPDLPMLAPIAYAASPLSSFFSQSMPHLELDDPMDHPMWSLCLTIPASPLPIYLHLFSSGVAQSMMPICRSALRGTLFGFLPLIALPLFVTVLVLGARAKKRLSP